MKLKLLVHIFLLFISCSSNYNKSERLYIEVVKENSSEKLTQAILTLNMIQSYQDDYSRGNMPQ